MKTVLVVEDDCLVRDAIVESLTDTGYIVSTVDNAEMALSMLQHTSVDLLFTDIRMPGKLDGWDLA